jgi:hypothetical protein
MQITTVSIFHFSGLRHQFWALSQMGLAPRRLGQVPGLQFIKFMGSGADRGFGIRPNFSVYSMLAVWNSEAQAQTFFEKHRVFLDYAAHCSQYTTHYLHNTMCHGLWDGQIPFQSAVTFDPELPVAVLTRATIKKQYLWRFWKQVPTVSAAIVDKPGLQFAIGIGELPFVQQATFSIWTSGRQMMDYAYRGDQHQQVIRQTRELGWYKEELFARFVPYKRVEK